MKQLILATRRFWKSECGATMVEYGLLVGLLSVVVIGSVVTVAKYVHGAFDQAQTEMANGGLTAK